MPDLSHKKLLRWLNIEPIWAWVAFAAATTIGLLNFGAEFSLHRSYDLEFDYAERLFDELTGTWSLLIPLPFILKAFLAWPITKANWARRIPLYLLLMIALGFVHTSIMTITRAASYPIIGFGTYDPGELLYRFAMETAKMSPGFWFLYFGHLFYLRNREKQRSALELARVQQELAEARLDSLKNQLNPHFLFNSLNMVSSIMYEDTKKADTLLADLSEFLRYNLSLEKEQTVSLRQELEITRKYLDIMQTRFGEKLQVSFETDPKLLDQQIPVFALQPLLENAIKFTMQSVERIGQIEVNISGYASHIEIAVADNGPGLKSNTSGTQTGIKNLRQRLDSLYGDNASFSLRNRPTNGAEAVIKIPLQPDSN